MRLKAIAAERAPTIAAVIQSACHQVGRPVAVKPRAASSAPKKAKGSAKSVCSILIISSVVLMLLAAVAISVSFKSKSRAGRGVHESARRGRGSRRRPRPCYWQNAKPGDARVALRQNVRAGGKALSTKPHETARNDDGLFPVSSF